MQKFKCDCCGLCCKHIDRVPKLKNFDSGGGVCKFLDNQTNLYKIYDKRLDLCNVEVGYKKYFADQYTEENFFWLNYKICEQLKRKHNYEVPNA